MALLGYAFYMRVWKLIFLLVLSLNFIISSYADEDISQEMVYSVALGLGPENEGVIKRVERLVEEINKLSKYKFELYYMPSARADARFKNRKVDASLVRVKEYQKQYPQAIMVSEAFASVRYHVYSSNKDIQIKTIDDLEQCNMVAVRGNVINQHLKKAKSITLLNNFEQALQFLHAKRADCMLANDVVLRNQTIDRSNIVDSLNRSESPIIIKNHYTFFQSDLEEVAQSYEAALKQLKQNGNYKRIIYDGILD